MTAFGGLEDPPDGRRVRWFSCGAASAIATKLDLTEHPGGAVAYCETGSEHEDNARFLKDCEAWFGVEITRLRSDKYADTWAVWEHRKYMSGIAGAPCTSELKIWPRVQFQQEGDVHVFGMTADESKRIQRFEIDNPELYLLWPLRDAGVDKQECLNMLMRAGIALPEMYLLGYENNNCLGCVKGKMGYWNKIRVDFPPVFERAAKQERKMGVHINGVYLDELPPDAGNYGSELKVECAPACELEDPEGLFKAFVESKGYSMDDHQGVIEHLRDQWNISKVFGQ